jgi:hypothetical protein
MSLGSWELVLPRPGRVPSALKTPIPGPAEAAFTETFGMLLPPAKYLKTANGKAAYYEMLPSTPFSRAANSQLVDKNKALIN